MTSPFDRLRIQILRTEAHFKSLKCPYDASSGNLSWRKATTGEWHIWHRDAPLLECAASIRIHAIDGFGALRTAILEARKDALSDAGLAAKRLEEQLAIWEQMS